jgi:hypothetical protein
MARVWHALDHHAHPLFPIWVRLLGIFASKGFYWKSWKGGQNSNYFYKDGVKYFVKGILRPDPGLEVRRKKNGPVIVKLTSDRDVWRFGDTL